MLNILDKVFEKIIMNKSTKFTENNGIIQNEQFGFRKDHSTTHQLKRIVNLIKRKQR